MKNGKQAVILAGGKGRRLEPYTTIIPKPLMPVGDHPILEIVIKQLRYYGFNRIKIAVGHLAGLIQSYFGDGSKFGVEIEYSYEDWPMGTVGPLSLMAGLDDDFLMLNGDLITDLDFDMLLSSHKKNKNLVTIGIYNKELKIDLGIIKFDVSQNVVDYIEKPSMCYPVSMGIYGFKKEASLYIPKNQKFDFPDLIKTLLKNNQKVGGHVFNGYWCDIGNHEDYSRVNKEYLQLSKKLLKE